MISDSWGAWIKQYYYCDGSWKGNKKKKAKHLAEFKPTTSTAVTVQLLPISQLEYASSTVTDTYNFELSMKADKIKDIAD